VKFRAILTGFITFALLVVVAAGAEKNKETGKSVDSGAFGIFINGRRMATETFSITQTGSGSVITSQFKTDAGVDKAEQNSELQISPTGELKKYEWKELTPQAQATVSAERHVSDGARSEDPRQTGRTAIPPSCLD
jgi:hypothetical protein